MGLHGQRHPSRRPPRPTSHTSVPARYSAVLRPLVKYPRFVMRGMRVGPTYTGHWSIVRPDWYSPAPTAPNSRLDTHGSPDHMQPRPWVGDPFRAGACLQSGKDSSPVNSATPLAEDGDPVRRPRSESQCRPDCGDCARLVAMARLPDCCWFHSSPVFFPAPSFCKGLLTRLRLLPDCPTRAA